MAETENAYWDAHARREVAELLSQHGNPADVERVIRNRLDLRVVGEDTGIAGAPYQQRCLQVLAELRATPEED